MLDLLVSINIWSGENYGKDKEMDVWVSTREKSSTLKEEVASEESSGFYNKVELDIFRMKGIQTPGRYMKGHEQRNFLQLADRPVVVGSETLWDLRQLTEASGDTSSLQAASTVKQWI